MRIERARMSKHNPVAKAITYMFEEDGRWEAFTVQAAFAAPLVPRSASTLDDGRILPDEQCGRTGSPRRRPRPQGLALRRIPARRRPRRLYVFPDRHGQDERHRPAGLAGRCPRPVPDMPLSRLPELLPWNGKRCLIAKAA